MNVPHFFQTFPVPFVETTLLVAATITMEASQHDQDDSTRIVLATSLTTNMPTTSNCRDKTPPLLTEIETILVPSEQGNQEDATFWIWRGDNVAACPPVMISEERLVIQLESARYGSYPNYTRTSQYSSHPLSNQHITLKSSRRDEECSLMKGRSSRKTEIINMAESFKELDEIVSNASACRVTTRSMNPRILTLEDEKKDGSVMEDSEVVSKWKLPSPITLSEKATAEWIKMSGSSSSARPGMPSSSGEQHHLSTEINQPSYSTTSTATSSLDLFEDQLGFNANSSAGHLDQFRNHDHEGMGSPKSLIAVNSIVTENDASAQKLILSIDSIYEDEAPVYSSFYQPFACLKQSLGCRRDRSSFSSSHDCDGTEKSQRRSQLPRADEEESHLSHHPPTTNTSIASSVGNNKQVKVPDNLAPKELYCWKSAFRYFTAESRGEIGEREHREQKDCFRTPLAPCNEPNLQRHQVRQKRRYPWGTKNKMASDETEKALWKTAVDPKSGRTYYYHVKTRETQWRKPAALATPEERKAMEEKERQQREFFAAMEANILKSISQGAFSGPSNSEGSKTQRTSPPLPSPRDVRENDKKSEITPGTPEEIPLDLPRLNLVRTISGMEDSVLVNLIQRVPSNRKLWAAPAAATVDTQQDIVFTPHVNDGRKEPDNRKLASAPPSLIHHTTSSSRAVSSSSRRSLTSIDEKSQASAETLLRGLSVRSKSEDSSDDEERVFGNLVNSDDEETQYTYWLGHEQEGCCTGSTVQSTSLDRQRSFGKLLADLPKEGAESMRSVYGSSGLDESNMNFRMDPEESQALEELAKVTDKMSQLEDEPFDKQDFKFLSDITEGEGGEESTTDRSDSDFSSKYESTYLETGGRNMSSKDAMVRRHETPTALTDHAGETPLPTRPLVSESSLTLQGDAGVTPLPARSSIREPSFTLQGDAGVTPFPSKVKRTSLIDDDDDDDYSPALRPPVPRAQSLRDPDKAEAQVKPTMGRRNTCGTLVRSLLVLSNNIPWYRIKNSHSCFFFVTRVTSMSDLQCPPPTKMLQLSVSVLSTGPTLYSQ